MAAVLTRDELLNAVRESGVVDESSLGSFLEQCPADRQDAEHLADSMHKSGLITRFQKDMLLQGKKRGYIIADKYILLDHLGAGGMGSVYLCQHKIMQRRVAIKVLPSAFAKDPEYLQRFHREARAAAALDHPNIVRAFDVDHDEKIHFLVMEYVEGASMQSMVAKEGPLDIRRAADYISQSAAGLEHAHEAGLVHRDIKPGNLLVDRKGTVKILDMGLALFFQEQGKSLTQQYDANAVLGTAEYLAPEQAVDSHGVDIRADIYSLGLTFFFLLTGKSPYGEEGTLAQKLIWHQMRTAKSVREFRPEVPEGLAAVISKMLAKKREERYQTPAEVVQALAPWVGGDGNTAATKIRGGGKRTASSGSGVSQSSVTTLHAAAPDTLPESEERARGAKTKVRPESGKRVKTAKIEKLPDDDEDEARAKGPRSSGKHKRGKNAAKGFWTPQTIVLVSAGGAVLLILLIGFVILATRPASTPKTAFNPLPLPPEVKKDDPKPPPVAPEKKVETPKEEVKPVPPPPKDKTQEPPPKVVTPKIDEGKPEVKKPPVKKTPEKKTPTPPAKESFADYLPRPGAILFYDVAKYIPGDKSLMGQVVRQKWEFKQTKDMKEIKDKELRDMKDGIVIDSTSLQFGTIEGALLGKKGKLVWAGPAQGRAVAYLRTKDSHIELGVLQGKTMFWDPILPLAAAEKETWQLRYINGDVKKYTIEKLDKAKHSVVIRSSWPALPEGEYVSICTYVKDKGEVSRSDSLERTAGPPQLLAEQKLVE